MNALVPELERRRLATQPTLDKYRLNAVDWRSGVTCIHLAWFQLRRMGHRPPPLPRIRSPLAARRELKKRGWADCAEVLDGIGLERIAPAQMMLGDLAVAPSADGLGAIFVCAGPLMLLGWHEDAETIVVVDAALEHAVGAWRL